MKKSLRLIVVAATHQVDHILPMAPYRQFVVTFPIPMRYWLHSNKELFSKVYRIIIIEIHSYYKTKALSSGIKVAKSGAISFTQLAGSALNLNPHLHILFCDGGVFRHESKRCLNLPLSKPRSHYRQRSRKNPCGN